MIAWSKTQREVWLNVRTDTTSTKDHVPRSYIKRYETSSSHVGHSFDFTTYPGRTSAETKVTFRLGYSWTSAGSAIKREMSFVCLMIAR